MSRSIEGTPSDPQQSYLDRLYKLVPIEITAAYTAIASITAPVDGDTENLIYLYISLALLTVLTPFYLKILQNVNNVGQLIVSTISFPIWALNISSIIFADQFNISNVALSVLLILWTLITPLIVGRNQ